MQSKQKSLLRANDSPEHDPGHLTGTGRCTPFTLDFFFQPNLWVLAELEITFTLHLALAQLKQESLCLGTVG